MKKTRKQKLWIFAAICIIAFFISSCDCDPALTIRHTITFDANGGEWADGAVFTTSVPDKAPIWDYRPSVPTRSGYNFKGWFSDRSALHPYDPNAIVTEDVTLYAGWTGNTVYRITFDTEGGTALAPQLVTAGSTAIEPANPERKGYSFAGWSIDGSATVLFDFSTPIRSNITLHAIWKEARKVSFTYDLPSSLGEEAVLSPLPDAIETPDGSILEEPQPKLSYNGTEFRFLGWFEENSDVPFDFSTGISRNMMLHGRWEEYAISSSGEFITYSSNGLLKWAESASSSFALIADITISDEWMPIGTSTTPFNAVFEGNGHSISGIRITGDKDHNGFFGYIGNNGTVRNLKLIGVSIKGSDSAGGIAGENLGTIDNCHVTGTIEESGIAEGGIAGRNRGTISDCSSSVVSKGYGDAGSIAGINYGVIENCNGTGSVSGEYAIGGIAGLNISGGKILSSAFSGTISDGYYAGGIAGCNDDNSLISGCSFTGNIQDMDWYIGGIAGLNSQESKIELCASSGNITGKDEAGGIVGYNFAGYVYACSFSGTVHSDTICGGIAGISMGLLEACYSSGTVSADSTAGGIAGINRFHVMTGCYTTGDTTAADEAGNIAGRNENASVSACYWQNDNDLPGIGSSMSSKTAEVYEIDEEHTWENAMSTMNAAISGSGYKYKINADEDTSAFPLVIEKT